MLSELVRDRMWQNMKDLLAPYVNASDTRPLSILQSTNTVPLQSANTVPLRRSLQVGVEIHIRHTRMSEFIHDIFELRSLLVESYRVPLRVERANVSPSSMSEVYISPSRMSEVTYMNSVTVHSDTLDDKMLRRRVSEFMYDRICRKFCTPNLATIPPSVCRVSEFAAVH